MRIAVAGGTGMVGRHVVREAETRGHEVVVLTRSTGTDLTSGEGLADSLAGVDAVVDVVSTPDSDEGRPPGRSSAASPRNLLTAEAIAGVGHHVVLSIVGIDLVPSGYYAGKLLQEKLTAAATVPWSILRATQFHEFAEQALGFATVGPFSLVPRMTTQPIAAFEVAAALVDLVERGPQGRVPDLAGPEKRELVELSRSVNRERRLGRRVVGVRLPGAWGRGMRSGALTPAQRRSARDLDLRGVDAPMTRQAELAHTYDAARPRLTRVAYAILGSRADAEDVVADTWLKLVAGRRGASPSATCWAGRRWRPPAARSTCCARPGCAARRTSVRGSPSRC